MANKAQKLLFNLSTMSPLVLIFAIVYWLEKDVKLFSEQEDKIQINVTVRHRHQPPHFSDHGGRGGHVPSGEALRGL
jgi:hypothetical protein